MFLQVQRLAETGAGEDAHVDPVIHRHRAVAADRIRFQLLRIDDERHSISAIRPPLHARLFRAQVPQRDVFEEVLEQPAHRVRRDR